MLADASNYAALGVILIGLSIGAVIAFLGVFNR